ncbi:MAG: hypothetical protein ACFB0B_17320 [Thermonemataceae bacterium]
MSNKIKGDKPTAGLFKTLGMLSELTPEQQALIKKLRIEGTHTAEEWLELLQEIVLYDTNNDAARKKLTNTMTLTGILAFISLFIIGGFPPILFLTLLLLLVLIVAAVLYYRLKGSDLPNLLRFYIFPLINVLKEESQAQAPLTIHAYLGKKVSEEFLVKEEANSNRGYPKVRTSHYEVPFLFVDTRLSDGSLLSIEMRDLIRKRRITKRNPRGKIKTKTKYKIKVNYEVRIGFPKKTYELTSTQAELVGNVADKAKVKFKENEKRNILNIRKRQIYTNISYVPDITFLLSVIADGYEKMRQSA